MTQREKEVLEIIKKNPLITQQELANQLGIERSSAAVHISNLSKKGIIKGKGYIIEEERYVLVIGGCNIDILGSPESSLIFEDSNPGTITTSPGGVARNIAENLGHLGIETKLLSAVGKDTYGDKIISATSSAGVDTHYIKRLLTKPTSIYMSILDENFDMKVAISHMDISKEIDIAYLTSHSDLIKNAAFVVIDTNLSQDVIDYLLTVYTETKFIVDTVSVKKSVKIKYHLDKIYSIKPNRKEVASIIDRDLNSPSDFEKALRTLQSHGVKVPMITLGKEGTLYLNKGEIVQLPSQAKAIVNANGAGDAFMAGIVYGFYHNSPISTTLDYGLKAAGKALETNQTVNQQLSQNDLL